MKKWILLGLMVSLSTSAYSQGQIRGRDIRDNTIGLEKLLKDGATAGQVITFDGTDVVWADPTGGGGGGGSLIVQLNDSTVVGTATTLDFSTNFSVSNSPSGEANIDLTNSGVSAGSYTLPTLTIDAKGRITAASSGSAAPVGATYITQTSDGTLTNEQALSGLTTGLVKVTTGTGVLSTAVAGTDYVPTSGTGATGTWSINISGNAATATSATTASALSGLTATATELNLYDPSGRTSGYVPTSDGSNSITWAARELPLTFGNLLARSGDTVGLDETGASEGYVIKYVSGVPTWAADATGGGGGGSLDVKNNNVLTVSAAESLDFSSEFEVTESPTGEANVAIDSVDWSKISGEPSTYAPSAHALVGSDHTASGLTTGHVLRATGSTTFAFQQLAHSDLSGVGTNTHSQIDSHIAATGASVHGLGTLSTQAANNVSITGGSISGITDLAVADGGTGASDASGARTNLGLVIGTDIPSPTGTGASGTWAINISGHASTASNAAAVTNGVYKNTANGFTASSDAAAFTSAPSTSTTSSMVRLGSPIAGGSSNGTYIGGNPTSFTGNWFDLQINGTPKFQVSAQGVITADGSGLTALNASNITSGTLDSNRLPTVPLANLSTSGGTDGEVLKLVSGVPTWDTDSTGGGGGALDVNEGGVEVVADATDLNFNGNDFDVTASTTTADVEISSAIPRKAQNNVFTANQEIETDNNTGLTVNSTTTLGTGSGGGILLLTDHTPDATGQRLGSFQFGTDAQKSVMVQAFSTESWSGTGKGAYLGISVVGNGETGYTEQMRVTEDGLAVFNPVNAASYQVGGIERISNSGVFTGNGSGLTNLDTAELDVSTGSNGDVLKIVSGVPTWDTDETDGGSSLTVENGDSGGFTATTVDFGSEFTITESPSGEANVSVNSIAGSKITGDISGNAATATTATNLSGLTITANELNAFDPTGRSSGAYPASDGSGGITWTAAPSFAPTNATYITQTANATLTNEQALSSLSTGIVKVTTGTGVLSTAVAGTDYLAPTGNGSGLTGLTGSQISGNISGNAANVTGVVAAANGGTGQSSYTTGDLLYASGSTALSKLAGVATGNALISGGTSTAPSWGKIGLTTHVSGTLPTANGGTGLTSFTSGGIPYATSTSALTTSSNLTYSSSTLNVAGNIRNEKTAIWNGMTGTFAQSNNQVAYLNLGSSRFLGSIEVTVFTDWSQNVAYGKLTRRFSYYHANGSSSMGSTLVYETVDASGPIATYYAIGDPEMNGTSVRVPIYQINGQGSSNNLAVQVKIYASLTSDMDNMLSSLSITAPATVSNSATRNHLSFMTSNLGIGVSSPSYKIQLADHTTATEGIGFGSTGVVSIHRNASNAMTLTASAGVTTTGPIIIANSAPPANATSTGTAGQIAWDANYLYVATGANQWKRAALSTW